MRWELRCYLDDGRICAADVPMEFELPWAATAVGVARLRMHRLHNAYLVISDAVGERVPLPQALVDNPP